jgi:glucosyl-dolichyl phosphate glucuronosyltransferase
VPQTVLGTDDTEAERDRQVTALIAQRDWPAISVCVCTHARPRYLAACLDSLRAQTSDPDRFEIVVVDSGSPPEAAAAIASLAASLPNARLLRLDRPGVSAARNAGARAASGNYAAYIDDDAVAAPDWVAQIRRVILEEDRPPAVLGGRVLPVWERPLPAWWPASLKGVLSIIEHEGRGEYRTPDLPPGLAPWTVNMVVERAAMLEAGGFDERLGRHGGILLSDEDKQLAWRLQASGRPARYDSRILVHHSIQAERMTPEWLIDRLYWQGFSTVLTRRLLRDEETVGSEVGRRLAVEALCAPASLLPPGSTRLLGLRWRLAYAKGYTRAALGCLSGKRARLRGAARDLFWRPPAQAVVTGALPAAVLEAIGTPPHPGVDPSRGEAGHA